MRSKFTISIPKIRMFLLACIYGFLNGSSQLNAQNIPDANFAAAIRADCSTCIDDSDSLLSPATILGELNIYNKNIADLTGIEGFTSLRSLDCSYNQLTSLPTLPNNLKRLICWYNQLTSLANLPDSLTYVECYANKLTSLPTLPTGLTHLHCFSNLLTSLPNLPASLTFLACSGNQLTSLPTLPSDLTNLFCYSNLLVSLPTLPNTLTKLHIDADKITCLPNLVEGLEVYIYDGGTDVLIPTPPVCTPFTPIHIPDDNFAAAIRTVCPACINASDTLLPPAANLTTLDVYNKNIADLTGVSGFTGLKNLYCGRNLLTVLPPLPSGLIALSCFSNQITTLPNLPENLQQFDCNTNQIAQMPTLPSGLKALYCPRNQMYCLPNLPSSLSILHIDANKIKCLPNAVTGLKIYDAFNNLVTVPVCTEACSETPCTLPPTPNLTANPTAIKLGESSTLTATNCAGTVTWSTGQTGNSISVSPTSFVNYQAFCTVDGCSSGYASRSVSIACEVPTPSLLATPGTISVGDSSLLTATGCETGILTWTLNSGSIGTGNSIKVKPTQTAVYLANCKVNGCDTYASIQVIVPCSVSSPIASASPGLISAGASSTLTATGCTGTVTWYNANTGTTIGMSSSAIVSPTQTTSYRALCSINNCTSSNSYVVVTVPCSVPTPSVSASPSSINAGQNATLAATGCTGTVTWFRVGQVSSIGMGNTITVSPVASSEYYAFCNVNNCSSGEARVVVTVTCEVPATPSLTASPSTISSGQNATLTATSCTGTVTWYNAMGLAYLGAGNSITVSPTANNSYFATCTVNGCQSGNSFVEVIVTTSGLRVSACTPPASPGVSANTYTANPSQSVTLTAANCAGTINWRNSTANTSLGTGASMVVTSTETTDYFAYCTLNGCSSGTSFVKIVVLCATPTPSVSAMPSIINAGGTATLNAANCNGTVNWFKSGTALGITGNSLTVTPMQSATYAANCTANGCTGSQAFASVQIACEVPPTPGLLATPGSIQSGQNATLTATGCAGTLRWYNSTDGGPSIATGTSIIVSPAKTTFYVGECNVNGCVSNSNVSVSVLCPPPPTPSVVASPSALSAGQPTTLTATNCAGTVTWYQSGTVSSIGTGNSITAIVTQSGYYSATCTVNGCQSNGVGVNVNVLCAVPPTPSVSATPSRVSSGQNATLTATGCAGTVTWYKSGTNDAAGTGNNLVVSPVSLTTYTAYCTVNDCISGGANVEVVVTASPCPPTKTLTGIVSSSSPITETTSVSIESTQIIQPNTNVTYRSPVILLKPGTEIQQGAIFKTEQGGCN